MKKYIISILFLFSLIFMPTNASAENYVAQIGDTKYSSLADAINAAEDIETTITLISEVELVNQLVIISEANITIDLNNQNMYIPSNPVEDEYGILNKGKLTITGNGEVYTSRLGIANATSGTLTINGGTYYCNVGEILLGNWGNLTITNGTFNSNKYILNNEGTASITGGTFNKTKEEAIKGNVSITNAKFEENNTPNNEPEKEYTITTIPSIDGKIDIDTTSATKGTSIKVTIIPDDGYELDTITIIDEDNNEIEVENNIFEMPESNVTITTTFKKIIVEEIPEEENTSAFIRGILVVGLLILLIVLLSIAKKKRA